MYKLNQKDPVFRLIFVSYVLRDINIDEAGEGLLERSQIRILSFFKKE